MKEIFFKGLVVALPVCIIGGLLYLIFFGFYSLYSDIRLKRELEQIADEAEQRRKAKPTQPQSSRTPTVEDLFRDQ